MCASPRSGPFDQLTVRFALYHLNIMAKKDDNRVGIGAKGMTGEGYKGHSFWDTEIFILPYFTLTQPEAGPLPAGVPLSRPVRRAPQGPGERL